MGYRRLPEPYDNVSVSEYNGGDTFRGRLAYIAYMVWFFRTGGFR